MFLPVLVIVFGAIWLLNTLGIISTSAWAVILPVTVILLGVSMLDKKKCGAHCWGWCGHSKEHRHDHTEQQ
jgi:hypothetical protein